MPGRRQAGRCLPDVTIWQFADAKEPIARLAKRASNVRVSAMRQIAAAEAAEEDDGGEGGNKSSSDVEDDAANLGSESRCSTSVTAAAPPVTYPALIWQLLSNYIHPESVAAFAALCRNANLATRRRAFWRRLYLRWAWSPAAEADTAAPHELTRSAILACQHAVRPRVIRALHRWHFAAVEHPAAAVPPARPPSGLRFQRFAVLAEPRRLLVLFQRGVSAPSKPRPPPDSWEAEADAVLLGGFGGVGVGRDDDDLSFDRQQRCPTEGQWLLVAELEPCGLAPSCLEDLLTLDGRCVMTGLRCLAALGGGGAVGKLPASARCCELIMRAPSGDCRSLCFACASAPRLLPWWRPAFLPALRSTSSAADVGIDSDWLGGW